MYLIFGGSGFIGTRLCDFLKSEDQNFLIVDKVLSDHFPDKSVKCDIRDREALSRIETDFSVIVNLAAEHRDDIKPSKLYDEVNVEGARNICDFADKKGIDRIVFTSSVAIYGFTSVPVDESGEIKPFNDYGRTKHEAEQIYQRWQRKSPEKRSLVIIRPTVVFGESNRGNVYNLFKQIVSGKFLMIGDGKNRKSMAYVGNVAAFLKYTSKFGKGIHIYNYIDKPDLDMNSLIIEVKRTLGMQPKIDFRLPYWIGVLGGYFFDGLALISRKSLPISSIRIKKFCKDSVFKSSYSETGFSPPVELKKALNRTILNEFCTKK